MLQPTLEVAEGQDPAPERGLEAERMNLSQDHENEGREPSLGSGCNSTSGTSVEKLLRGSKDNDAKLENNVLRLTAMQK